MGGLRAALVAAAVAALSMPASAETGLASFYGGQRVACPGMRVGPMTAAHRSLPCGSRVRVTAGDKSVTVTITDRGPYVRGRIIDLSRDAAAALGIIRAGVARVTVNRI